MMWFFPWLVSTGLMLWLVMRLDQNQKALRMEKSRSHAFCVATLFAVTDNAHTAAALRAAADRWDSVEEQHRIKLLSRDYAPGGPSMPAIWLRAEADRMDPALAEETVNG